jgi:biopolymer transport protein ExbB
MGLLGTIFGMIKAFKTVAGSADALGRTELLATGIYEALITTAGGLLLAIPTLMAYYYFAAKIEQLVCEIDAVTVDFIEEHGYACVAVSARSPKLRAVDRDDDEESPEDAVLEKTTARA